LERTKKEEPFAPPEGMELSGITHKGYSYRKPEVKEPSYSADVISASNLLDMKPEDVKAEHIIRAKGIEKSIGQGKVNSAMFSQARNLAFSQLGGSSMMGMDKDKSDLLLPKTIEIYNQLMALENPEGGGTTKATAEERYSQLQTQGLSDDAIYKQLATEGY
jgi:hypothetical protein